MILLKTLALGLLFEVLRHVETPSPARNLRSRTKARVASALLVGQSAQPPLDDVEVPMYRG